MAQGRKGGSKSITGRFGNILLIVLMLILVTVAFLSIYAQNRKSDLTNIVVGELDVLDSDMYRVNEPVHGINGSVVISNVEEYGKTRQNISAIIHYYNTTPDVKNWSATDIGRFTDGFQYYNYVGYKNEPVEIQPGESATYKVSFEREDGTRNLFFVPSEVAVLGENDYEARIDISTQMSEEKILDEKTLYGFDLEPEVLDLSLEENAHQVLTGAVFFDPEGNQTDTLTTEIEEAQQAEEEEEAIESPLVTGQIDGINRQLTQAELEALGSIRPAEEIEEALRRLNLPGLIEWGYVYRADMPERQQRKIEGFRDTRGLRVLTQQEGYSSAIRASGRYLDRDTAIRLGLVAPDEVPEGSSEDTVQSEYSDIEAGAADAPDIENPSAVNEPFDATPSATPVESDGAESEVVN